MRRTDREVTDPALIEDIVRRCSCCRVGFCDDGEVYIVPLSFGCEIQNDTYVFYFHGAKEGRKIDLIHKNPKVGFEMDTNYRLNEGDAACRYSARFQSLIGNGVMSMVTEKEEKLHGLSVIMEQHTGRRSWTFEDAMVEAVAVMKLEVTRMTCKEHK